MSGRILLCMAATNGWAWHPSNSLNIKTANYFKGLILFLFLHRHDTHKTTQKFEFYFLLEKTVTRRANHWRLVRYCFSLFAMECFLRQLSYSDREALIGKKKLNRTFESNEMMISSFYKLFSQVFVGSINSVSNSKSFFVFFLCIYKKRKLFFFLLFAF